MPFQNWRTKKWMKYFFRKGTKLFIDCLYMELWVDLFLLVHFVRFSTCLANSIFLISLMASSFAVVIILTASSLAVCSRAFDYSRPYATSLPLYSLNLFSSWPRIWFKTSFFFYSIRCWPSLITPLILSMRLQSSASSKSASN